MDEPQDAYSRFEREIQEWEKVAYRKTQRRAELLAWFYHKRLLRMSGLDKYEPMKESDGRQL